MENNLAPMTWKEFKNLEKEGQRNYLQQLIDTYGANAVTIAEMFHIGAQTVRKYIAEADLGIKLSRGSRVDRARWQAFLGIGKEEEPAELPADTGTGMQIDSLSMHFSGKIDVDLIAASLHKVFDGAGNGEVEISCRISNQ